MIDNPAKVLQSSFVYAQNLILNPADEVAGGITCGALRSSQRSLPQALDARRNGCSESPD